jgi:hypothetical protein
MHRLIVVLLLLLLSVVDADADSEEDEEEGGDVPDGPPKLDASGQPIPQPKKKKKMRKRTTHKLPNKPQDFQVG